MNTCEELLDHIKNLYSQKELKNLSINNNGTITVNDVIFMFTTCSDFIQNVNNLLEFYYLISNDQSVQSVTAQDFQGPLIYTVVEDLFVLNDDDYGSELYSILTTTSITKALLYASTKHSYHIVFQLLDIPHNSYIGGYAE